MLATKAERSRKVHLKNVHLKGCEYFHGVLTLLYFPLLLTPGAQIWSVRGGVVVSGLDFRSEGQ